MRLILIIILFVFSIGFVSCLDIGISPSKVEFNNVIGEEKCKNVILYSDEKVVLIGRDVWSDKFSNSINNYNLSSDEFGLNITYTKNVSFEDKKQVSVCVNGFEEGRYYGVLFYKMYNGNVGVGNFITVDVSSSARVDDSESVITGLVINGKSSGEDFDGNKVLIILIMSSVFLFGVFCIVLFKYRNVKRDV